MTRCAIYARYSSNLQSDRSIEDQVKLCRALSVRERWDVVSVFRDRAVSGASHLRGDFQSLLAGARERRFDVVVSEALDRLSRDQEHVAAFYKQMAFAGVRIVTISEGEISELHVGLKGTMNALFLKDLAAKTHRGLRGRVEDGKSGGGLCFGYRVVRKLDAKGDPIRGLRAIEPAEAKTVRAIFRWFAGGESPRSIAKRLNADKVPGPGGRLWAESALRGNQARGTGVLRNRLYAGELVWNRLRYIKDPDTGKRVSRINPVEDLVVESVPDLRIVDRVLWDSVVAKLESTRAGPVSKKIRQSRFWEHKRPTHLLSGRSFCGVCGGHFAALGRDYLACSNARRFSSCSNTKSLRRQRLELIVLEALQNDLMKPEAIAAFVEGFTEEFNRAGAERAAGRISEEKELSDTVQKISRLVDSIADGAAFLPLKEKLGTLDARRIELELRLATPAPPALRLHPRIAERYRDKVALLRSALDEREGGNEIKGAIRLLVERVEIRPATSGDGTEVALIGEISEMIRLATGAKNTEAPAIDFAGARRSAKVVAGTRNQRDPRFKVSI